MEHANKAELLTGCSGDIAKRLADLVSDVAHVQSLVDNANDAMTKSLHDARRHVLHFRAVADKLLHELPDEDHAPSLLKLDEVQGNLRDEANKALRSLQYHDLVTQILNGMKSHLHELEIDMRTLTSVASGVDHHGEAATPQHVQVAKRAPQPRRASIPRDLAEGEVELFGE